MQNSVIETLNGVGPWAVTIDAGTVISTARYVTLVDKGGDENPAVYAEVFDEPGNGLVNFVVRDTNMAGYENPPGRCPYGAGVGDATVSAAYSYLLHSALIDGDRTVPVSQTIDEANPLFGPPQFIEPATTTCPRTRRRSTPAIR